MIVNEKNPNLYKLYVSLNDHIVDYIDPIKGNHIRSPQHEADYDNIVHYDDKNDDIILAILKCNDDLKCNEDAYLTSTEYLGNDIYMIYVEGVVSEKELPFDVISTTGTTYIVVFMDYYDKFNKEAKLLSDEEINNLSIEEQLRYKLGNSTAFNAIEMIVSTVTNIMFPYLNKLPPVSSLRNIVIDASILIPAAIISNITQLLPQDSERYYEFITQKFSTGLDMKLYLMGIDKL